MNIGIYIYPDCKQNLKNCFAYDSETGKCKCLSDTDFNRKCPFYKDKKDVDLKEIEEITKYKRRY